MKKLFRAIILLTVVAFTACASKSKDADTTKEEVKAEVKAGTIHLTKAEFLAKVANYETNPNEWKYLGDKPCIIDFYVLS